MEAETLALEFHLCGAFLWLSDGGVAALTLFYKSGSSLRPVWMLKIVSARLPAGKGAKRMRTLVAWGRRAVGQTLYAWVWPSLLGGPLG